MTGVEDFEFLDEAVQECPYDFYKAMREEQPVYQVPGMGFYIVSRYEDVLEALRSPDVFSSKMGFRPGSVPAEAIRIYEEEGYGKEVDTLVSNDPPSHTRFRALVDRAFTPSRVKKMESYIDAIAQELIDSFIEAGEVDIHKQFSIALPLMVIADQLGVPRADMDKFKEWSDAAVLPLGLIITDEQQIECAKLGVEMQHYFVARFEERRKEPKDDMLTDLVQARIEGEQPLNTEELLSIVQQLLVAGNETTTSAISSGVMLLINNPDQIPILRADRKRYETLAEEVLRAESPVQGLFRMTTRDVEIGGTTIPQGSTVNLRYGSANRDDGRFEGAEKFDVCRKNAGAHLAFGAGIHHCIGAQLARREIIVALRGLVERLDDMELAVPEEDLHHFPSVILRGYTALPIRFKKRAESSSEGQAA